MHAIRLLRRQGYLARRRGYAVGGFGCWCWAASDEELSDVSVLGTKLWRNWFGSVVIGSECFRRRRVEEEVRVLAGAVTARCAEEKDRRGKSVKVSF